jgi:hypothetical protein
MVVREEERRAGDRRGAMFIAIGQIVAARSRLGRWRGFGVALTPDPNPATAGAPRPPSRAAGLGVRRRGLRPGLRLAAGALASYLLGDSVLQFST